MISGCSLDPVNFREKTTRCSLETKRWNMLKFYQLRMLFASDPHHLQHKIMKNKDMFRWHVRWIDRKGWRELIQQYLWESCGMKPPIENEMFEVPTGLKWFEQWERNSNPMRPVALSQGTLKRNTSFETRLLSRHHGNWSHYKKIDISVNQIQLIWNMPNYFKRQQSTCVARLIAQTKDRLYSLLYHLLAVVGWEILRREVQRKVWLKLKQTRTFVRSKR